VQGQKAKIFLTDINERMDGWGLPLLPPKEPVCLGQGVSFCDR
jgi:hypothetical protein